jgi:hypothetical protein
MSTEQANLNAEIPLPPLQQQQQQQQQLQEESLVDLFNIYSVHFWARI